MALDSALREKFGLKPKYQKTQEKYPIPIQAALRLLGQIIANDQGLSQKHGANGSGGRSVERCSNIGTSKDGAAQHEDGYDGDGFGAVAEESA